MGKEIDWTKAPEGATHWDTDAEGFCADGIWWCIDSDLQGEHNDEWGSDRYIPRPLKTSNHRSESIVVKSETIITIQTDYEHVDKVYVNGKLYASVPDGEC